MLETRGGGGRKAGWLGCGLPPFGWREPVLVVMMMMMMMM